MKFKFIYILFPFIAIISLVLGLMIRTVKLGKKVK